MRIETREREIDRDKDGAANSFPTVYRDNFFGNFFDKYTSATRLEKRIAHRTFEWKPGTIAKIRYLPMATGDPILFSTPLGYLINISILIFAPWRR